MRIKGYVPEFKDKYFKSIRSYLKNLFHIKNDMAIPKLTHATVNIGFGTIGTSVQRVLEVVRMISCHSNPKISKAKRGIANFSILKGKEIGVFATCRDDLKFVLLQRTLYAMINGNNKCPKLKISSINKNKNTCSITIGFCDVILFDGVLIDSGPTIGCGITIVGLAKTKEQFAHLLMAFGFPFEEIEYNYNMLEVKNV